MRNPWLDYDYQTHGFHPLDEAVAARFNAGKNKPLGERHALHPEDNAQPYFGNHVNPAIAILMANPGYKPDEAALEQAEERRHLLDLSRRHQLEDKPFMFLRGECATTPGPELYRAFDLQISPKSDQPDN